LRHKRQQQKGITAVAADRMLMLMMIMLMVTIILDVAIVPILIRQWLHNKSVKVEHQRQDFVHAALCVCVGFWTARDGDAKLVGQQVINFWQSLCKIL